MSPRGIAWAVVVGIAVLARAGVPAPAAADECHAAAHACGGVAAGPCWPCPPVECSYGGIVASWRGFGGFGFGITRFRSFTIASPGMWCGTFSPCVVPVYPCGVAAWYPCVPQVYQPWIYRPWAFSPWVPCVQRPAVQVIRIAARPAPMERIVNQATRQRAHKLVAIGDRHLRDAAADRVAAPAKLHAALDAYRRAEKIAADEPDTCLRQAIVLTALDRATDADKAVGRAVAIDGRLAESPAAVADATRPPADPVFGDRPLGAPTLLAERSASLLAGIFSAAGAASDEPNWIADSWQRRGPDGRGLIAAR